MSEFDPEIYTRLPLESRLYALGLCGRPIRGVGRPKSLSYQRRFEIYVAWWGALNARAVHLHDRKRDRAVAKLQAKFRTLSAAGTPTHEITTAINKIGRVSRVPIEPPTTCYPELDRAIAEQFGISPRMVRRIRVDRRLKKFKPHPAWHERSWEKPAREAFAARQVAKRLMTPQRFAKGEAIALDGNGRLLVTQDSSAAAATYKTALGVFRRLQRLEPRLPPEYRRRPTWLGFRPQWTRIETRMTGIDRHLRGRRVSARPPDA